MLSRPADRLQGWWTCNRTSLTAAYLTGSGLTCIVVAILAIYLLLRRTFTIVHSSVPDTPASGNPEDEIHLYGFLDVKLPSVSPFTRKVEAFLQFAGLPYHKHVGLPSDSPKGKIPFMKHGRNTVPDSAFIIRYLQNTYGPSSTDCLALRPKDAQQAALVQAYTALVESNITNALVYYRWVHDEGGDRVHNLLKPAPPAMRPVIAQMLRARNSRNLWDKV
ncbi:hypothetical protein WJX73_003358 [Symbiochloris irregularis]|uniref:Thioredoxin-like fold domain-containing protein n=1 Tax=Symbiochloris irregularis TaxID=706552 RepID=A0AAW1PN38_9CHLO